VCFSRQEMQIEAMFPFYEVHLCTKDRKRDHVACTGIRITDRDNKMTNVPTITQESEESLYAARSETHAPALHKSSLLKLRMLHDTCPQTFSIRDSRHRQMR
jgi:hypothetical protein